LRDRARFGGSSACGHRARHPRADSGRAGDERKNVGASCDAGERGKAQSARRRIHRAGRRDAGVRIRRTRPVVESERDRVPRGISSYPARQTDRVTFLITAGPTREPIDPVRYISNRSSGKMGYAIAEAALDVGHDVVLVSGPVTKNTTASRRSDFGEVVTFLLMCVLSAAEIIYDLMNALQSGSPLLRGERAPVRVDFDC